jgi:ADP-heptose:LPS heptosyltransferase
VAGRIPALIDADPVVRQIRIRDQEVRLPGEPIPGVRRIVLVQNGTLEDLIFSLPAIHAVRDAYPHAWLAVLVRKSTAPLVRLVPVIQEILIAGPGTHELEASIRSFNADLLISLSRGSGVAMAGWRVKVPHRIGTGFRVFSSRFTRQVKERRRNGTLHEVDYGLSFAHRVGATAGPPQFGIHVPEKAKVGVRHWLELQGLPDKVIVIHPEEGRPGTAWPGVHFVQLATLLEAEGRRIVFSTDGDCRRFIEALDDEHLFLQRLPRFTGELVARIALFSLASVVVGNGSGAAHLAAALGVPTLTFHPPWRSCGVDRLGPYAANGWALEAASQRAQRWSGRKRLRHGSSLMGMITPADARKCVVAILEGADPAEALSG